jgi:lipopolysaccharide transport system permease protein
MTDVQTSSPEWVIEPRVASAVSRMGEVWRYRALLKFFASRAVSKLYRRTVLGRAWLFIRPLFPLLVKTLIFGSLLNVGSSGVPYFVFLVVGTAAWELFSGSTTWGTRSLELNRGLITRIYVPRLILPMAMLALPLVTFGLHLVVGAAAVVWYRVADGVWYVPGGWQVLWAVLGFFLCLLLGFAISLWTSVLGAQARDVRFTLNYVLDFWFFLTPVLYPLSAISPERQWLMYLNPMTSIVELVKFGLLGIGAVHPQALGGTAGLIVVVLVGGLWFFGKAESVAVDRV